MHIYLLKMNRSLLILLVLATLGITSIHCLLTPVPNPCRSWYCYTCTTNSKCDYYCRVIGVIPKYHYGFMKQRYTCTCCYQRTKVEKCVKFVTRLNYYTNSKCISWCKTKNSLYDNGYANGDGTCKCCYVPKLPINA